MDYNKIVAALDAAKGKRIVVIGDYCLDKYIYSDPAEDDISVETGLYAHQVYLKKMSAGGAGSVSKNLATLGAKVICVGFVGDDGEGYELIRELNAMGADTSFMLRTPELATATYMKTMRKQADGSFREETRIDFRNRGIPENLRARIEENFKAALKDADGVMVLDQFFERNSGVIGDGLRETVNELSKASTLPFLADSRSFISEFRNCYVKCNNLELMKICLPDGNPESLEDIVKGGNALMQLTGKPVFTTRGTEGIVIFDGKSISKVPAYVVTGEIDIVGAGDASSASLILSLCAGLSCAEAAVVACAVSSITIQQIGTTGSTTVAEAAPRIKALCELCD